MSFKEKLLELQKRVKPIKKEEKNPYFNSTYFNINGLLAEIKPLLSELGLILSQPISILDGRNIIKTIIRDAETKEGDDPTYIESNIVIPEVADAQKLGSAITYLRRYSIQSLLALEAEVDDDGNLASGHVWSTNKDTTSIFDEKPPISHPVPSQGQRIHGAGIYFEGKSKKEGNKCSKCEDGTYVTSPKSGKVFCDKKCWLRQPPIQQKTGVVVVNDSDEIPF